MLQDRSLDGDKLINSSHILESVQLKHIAILSPHRNRSNSILRLGALHVFMRVID